MRKLKEIIKFCSGFNRYMVECECTSARSFPAHLPVLIDTWWNVNFCFYVGDGTDPGFNRYMVECEYGIYM